MRRSQFSSCPAPHYSLQLKIVVLLPQTFAILPRVYISCGDVVMETACIIYPGKK